VVPVVARGSGQSEPLPLLIVRTGGTPVRQGEPCSGLWVVESGVLLATVVTAEGRELALDVLGANDAVGEPGGAPGPCTVRALRPARLRPVTDATGLAIVAARARRVSSLAGDLAWHDVETRIERRMLDLAVRFGRPALLGTVVPLRLTQDDLASLAGTTRESANRAIRRLIDRGRIGVERPGRYVVRSQLRLVAR
jgi:CRP/FNR family transcriptional regulator, cyclic AMP receptor protein